MTTGTTRSLSRTYPALTVGLVTVMLLSVGALLTWNSGRVAEELIFSKSRALLRLMAKTGARHFANFDFKGLEELSDNVLQDRDVRYAAFYDASGSPMSTGGETRADSTSIITFSEAIVNPETGDTIGSVVLGYDRAVLTETRSRGFTMVVVTTLVALAISAIGMIAITKTLVVDRLRATIERLTDIAQGEGDLTKRLAASSRDEFGELARWFNTFMARLQHIIRDITQAAVAVASSTKDLRHASGGVLEASQEAARRSTEVSEATASAAGNIETISNSSVDVSHAVRSVAAAIEEMDSSLQEVAANCHEEATIANDAESRTKVTREKVAALGERSKAIHRIVEVISKIADQTNLLALNATIEAASAGEAGKGFAVVANEVKELARQTAQATDEIAAQVGDVQGITTEVVKAIEEISRVIERVNSISQSIASAVEQQSTAVREIAGTISQTSKATSDIATGVQTASERIARASETVSLISVGAVEAAGSFESIDKSLRNLSSRAEELQLIVAQFKTGQIES
jgi:methyl-accepting chemotaxis protein